MRLQQTEVNPQQQAAQEIQQQLVSLEGHIQERSVLGENSDVQREQAYDLLEQYSWVQGWTATTYDKRWGELAVKLNNPTPSVYHSWINTFANCSINNRLQADLESAHANAYKARLALSNLAQNRGWDAQKYNDETRRLEKFLNDGESTPAELSRAKKLQAGLGLMVTGAFARLGSVGQSTKDNEPEATSADEQKRRRKYTILAVSAGVGALALGTAGLLIGFDVFGSASKAHQHMGNMQNPMKTPHSAGASQALPTPTTTSTPSQGIKPTIPSHPIKPKLPQHGIAPGKHRLPQNTNQVRPHVERLQYHLDNIWEHARRALGKKATTAQIAKYDHKILKVNHLTGQQARHMSIYRAFLMPATK